MDCPQQMSSEMTALEHSVFHLKHQLSFAKQIYDAQVHTTQNLIGELEYVRNNSVLKSTHFEVLEQNKAISQNNTELLCQNNELSEKFGEHQQVKVTLQAENSRLQNDNIKLKQETENFEEQYTNLTMKYDVLFDKLRKSEETVREQKVKVSTLEAELSHLKSHNADVVELRDKLGKADAKILKLTTDLQAAVAKVNLLNNENQDMSQKSKILENSNQINSGENETLKGENKNLLGQTKKLEEEKKELEETNEQINSINVELICKNQELTDKTEEQQQATEILRVEKDLILSENSILQEDSLRLTRELENRDKAARRLQLKLQKLEAELSSTIANKTEVEDLLVKFKRDLQTVSDNLNSLAVENDELSKKNSSLNVGNQQLSEKNQNLEILNQYLSKKKKCLENSQRNMSGQNETLENENQKLLEKVKMLEGESKEKQPVNCRNQEENCDISDTLGACNILSQKIKVLEGERNALQQEQKEILTESEQRIRILDQKLLTNKSLHEQEKNELEDSLKNEREKLALVESNCGELKNQNKELHKKIKKLKRNFKMCQAKILTFEEQQTRAETSHKVELEVLNQKLNTANSDILVLNCKLRNSQEKVNFLNNQEYYKLSEKCSRLEKLNQNLSDTNKVVENLNQNLSETNQVLEMLNQDLMNKNKNLTDLNQELSEEIKRLGNCNDDILDKNNTLVNENKQLSEKTKKSEDENNQLQKEKEEIRNLNEALMLKSSQFQSSDEALKNLRSDHETLKNSIDSERSNWNKKLWSESNALEVTKSKNYELSRQIKSLQKQLSDLKAESEGKSISIAVIRKKVQCSNAEVEKLRVQIEEMTTEKGKLISELNSIKKSESVKYERLIESNRKLQHENEKLNRNLQENTTLILSQREEISQQQVALDASKTDVAEQEKNLMKLQDEIKENQAKIKELEDDAIKKYEMLNEFVEHLNTLEVHINHLKSQLESRELDNSHLKWELEQNKRVDSDKNKTLQRKEQEIVVASAKIKELEESLEKSKSYNAEAAALTKRLLREKTNLQSKLQDFESQALPEKLAELKQSLKTNSLNLKLANGTNDTLRSEIQSLEQTIEAKLEEIQKLKNDLRKSEKAFKYVSLDLIELESENELLRLATPKRNSGESDDESNDEMLCKKARTGI